MSNNELYHYGTKHHSGRYAYGSGDRPMQHEPGGGSKSNPKIRKTNSGTGAKLKKASKTLAKLAKRSIASGKKAVKDVQEKEKEIKAQQQAKLHAAAKAAEEKRIQEEKAKVEEFKKKIVESGDVKKLRKNVDLFTNEELKNINTRLSELRKLNGDKKDKNIVEKTQDVSNLINNLATATNNSMNLYNNVAATMNALGGRQMPLIKNAKTKFAEDQTRKLVFDKVAADKLKNNSSTFKDYDKAFEELGKSLLKAVSEQPITKPSSNKNSDKKIDIPEAVDYVKPMSESNKKTKTKSTAAEDLFTILGKQKMPKKKNNKQKGKTTNNTKQKPWYMEDD